MEVYRLVRSKKMAETPWYGRLNVTENLVDVEENSTGIVGILSSIFDEESRQIFSQESANIKRFGHPKDDLSGTGAYLYGGRWNSKGEYALYGASHISLAVLEILVNFDKSLLRLMPSYHLLTMAVPDALILSYKHTSLKPGWQHDVKLTQFIGDGFLQSRSGVIMEVPSAVIPEESNYLINPLHPDFEKIKLLQSQSYNLDKRLIG